MPLPRKRQRHRSIRLRRAADEGTSSRSSNSGDDDDDGGGGRPSSRRRGTRPFRLDDVSSFRLQRPRAEDRSSSSSGDDAAAGGRPSLWWRYLQDRLNRLNLPPSADGVEPDSVVDRLDLLTYGEILEALTCSSFLNDKMLRDAVGEYQVRKYLREQNVVEEYGAADSKEESVVDYSDPQDETWTDSDPEDDADDYPGCSLVYDVPEDDRELDPRGAYRAMRYLCTPSVGADDAICYSVDDDITYEEFAKDSKQLKFRRTPVNEYDKLDLKKVDELELKRALYRIKAILLLKGKAIDKLDDAALESKYPRKIIVENSYFLNYENHEAFGWYFDSKFCEVAALTDYQRLVILNYPEERYQEWSRYRSHYNTPEADRDYLLYWKAITEKIKWIEHYMDISTFSPEWSDIERIASYQAIRIAVGFKNIHKDLALLGIEEFLWSTRLYVHNLKDLDGVFYEIWRRVIKEENVKDCFAKALKEVYDLKMFPSRELSMTEEHTMAEQFHLCTAGITKEVPESIARGLIAQQVRRKLALTRGYEHYARKKLKVAEYIGLIGKAST